MVWISARRHTRMKYHLLPPERISHLQGIEEEKKNNKICKWAPTRQVPSSLGCCFCSFSNWQVLWGRGQIHRLYAPARGVLQANAVKPSPPSHAGLLLPWWPINLTQPQYSDITVNITAACFVYCFALRGGGRWLLLCLPSGPQTRSQTELLASTQPLRSNIRRRISMTAKGKRVGVSHHLGEWWDSFPPVLGAVRSVHMALTLIWNRGWRDRARQHGSGHCHTAASLVFCRLSWEFSHVWRRPSAESSDRETLTFFFFLLACFSCASFFPYG